MDTYGLGLENFDGLGKWRDSYRTIPGPIDASGTLANGTEFKTPPEMYDGLAKDPQTQTCLAQQLLAYVLTRATTSADDRCVSKVIGQQAVTASGRLTDLLTKIVGTRQFLMQTGEAP
jgi:hypothetical protein